MQLADTKISEERVRAIAAVVHDANRSYCQTLGDHSQQPFYAAAPWQVAAVIDGVRYRIAYPTSTAEDLHENWCAMKRADGWTLGAVKDADAKTHPCLVPYAMLPVEQRRKDSLLSAIVDALIAD